ncbi:hypothetical protein AOLI_G00166050 [Acnodon oligacanthus]
MFFQPLKRRLSSDWSFPVLESRQAAGWRSAFMGSDDYYWHTAVPQLGLYSLSAVHIITEQFILASIRPTPYERARDRGPRGTEGASCAVLCWKAQRTALLISSGADAHKELSSKQAAHASNPTRAA